MENKQHQHIQCRQDAYWMDFVNSLCERWWLLWSRDGWQESERKRENCLNTCTPLRQYAVSSTPVMMQEQAWMHPSSSPLSPPCPRLILSSLNNPPPPPNWHGTHQVGDRAGDSEVAPRLGLFTRAVALQRLWYFFFQMPGMERHVMGNTKSLLSLWLFPLSVALSVYFSAE